MGPRRRRTAAPEIARTAKAFGTQLQRIRRDRSMKQDAFAKEMGVSRTTVSNIECGRQRIFLDQVYRAAAILKVPVNDLLLSPIPSVDGLVVHTALDDPLSRSAAKSVARAVAQVMGEPTSQPTRGTKRSQK